MAVEILTSYTKVDDNSRLTVTTTKATGVDVGRDEDVYLYKDQGANRFNDLFISVKLLISATSVHTASAAFGGMAISNTVGSVVDFVATDIYVAVDYEGAGNLFKVFLGLGAGVESDNYIGLANTPYYCLLERAENSDTATLKIYSEASRTTLLDTLTVTGVGTSTKWRYSYGFVNWNSGGADVMFDGYVQDLNLSLPTATPHVSTEATTDIDKATATGNGTVLNLGIPPATQHGHCWATWEFPQVSNPAVSKTELGAPSATGAYTSSITGLLPNTRYYIYAYISNALGNFYGTAAPITTGSFETLPSVPGLRTATPYAITCTTAIGGGWIDNDGGSDVIQHGVLWRAAGPPTISLYDGITEDGPRGEGYFDPQMTGLIANTLYHYRAYAINEDTSPLVGYGDVVIFTTMALGAPLVSTQNLTDVANTTATGHGTIIDVMGSAVTEWGICWGETANPERTDSGSGYWGKAEGSGVAVSGLSFFAFITGLTGGKEYFFRAYAKNTQGTGYGNNDTISGIAGELRGNFAVVGEYWVYASKTGAQRKILGVPF